MPPALNNKMDTSASTLPLTNSLMVYLVMAIVKPNAQKYAAGKNKTGKDL
jgi:hypothetical protein